MTSNKDIEPTHYGTDFSLSGISDNDLWIENSSQISRVGEDLKQLSCTFFL